MTNETGSAANIAETAATLFAQAAEAASPHGAADAQEIRQITEAMLRLLLGVPLRSDGQLTIKSLAAEAGLLRNKLTHKHTSLKDLFYALVKAQNATPKIAEDLQHENDELREKNTQLRKQNTDLTEAVKRFARVVHILEVENQQLRDTANDDSTLRVLPTGRRQGDPTTA